MSDRVIENKEVTWKVLDIPVYGTITAPADDEAHSAVIFVAGIGAAFLSRHDKLCKDGKAPVAQKAAALEPTLYLCHDGQIVTK